MLRIVGGKYRHRNLIAPSTSLTRPTTDKVREALMSALGMNTIIDAVVLDLFAGSGALGLEALSRGASKIYFCDNNHVALKTIKQNIETLGVKGETEVLACSYQVALNQLRDEGLKFDIVFLDPPYIKEEIYNKVCDFLFENEMLKEDGIVVKEWNKPIPYDDRFSFHRDYKYGTIHLLIERR